MPRKPKGDRPRTARERKASQRIRDRRLLNEALLHPEGAPLRTLLQLISEGHEFAWREVGRQNGWIK